MKKEKVERISKFIIVVSIISVVIADFFFAYFLTHHSVGLMSFDYKTNLYFLLMFTFPIIFIIIDVVSFIKECVLYKNKETKKEKFKMISASFLTMLAGFSLYALSSFISHSYAIYLGGASVLLIVASVILMFIYFRKAQ